jgi:hypothetical protein
MWSVATSTNAGAIVKASPVLSLYALTPSARGMVHSFAGCTLRSFAINDVIRRYLPPRAR